MEDEFKKRIDDLFAQIGANEKLQDEKLNLLIQQLSSMLVTLGMGFYARYRVRKAATSMGLSEEQAKQLAKALPWLAYQVGANAKTGVNSADRLQAQTDALNNKSTNDPLT